jgi:Uma2 family endonuclease
MTAEQLLELPRGAWRYELIEGELRRMSPAGHVHGAVAMRIGARLASFVEEHRLGVAYAAETGFILARNPDTVRAPDAAFLSNATLERLAPTGAGYFPGAPDLAVEVISPDDSKREVQEKVTEWLRAGTKVVIVLDPSRTSADAHSSDGDVQSLHADGRLTVPELLPGWSVPMRELFR